MKVGDIVMRSYRYKDMIPGIIVEEKFTEPSDSMDVEILLYDVLWSNGTLTTEMYQELVFYEDVAHLIHK